MTNIQSNPIDEFTDIWTCNYMIDALKQQLSIVKYSVGNKEGKNLYDCRKYYDLAHKSLKIACFNPVPKFPIDLSDLTSEIIQKLYDLEPSDLNYVLKQAVARIFEDVNSEIFHNSVSSVLEVELLNE